MPVNGYGNTTNGIVPMPTNVPMPYTTQGSVPAYNNYQNPQSYNQWVQNYGRYPMSQGNGAQPSNQPQCVNNVIQVMGPESALSYQVGPNSMVIMMDSNRPVFYIKRSDDSGYSETKAFEFHEIPLMDKPLDITPQMDEANFVTKEDIEELKKQLNRRDTVSKKDFDALKKMIEGLGTNNG